MMTGCRKRGDTILLQYVPKGRCRDISHQNQTDISEQRPAMTQHSRAQQFPPPARFSLQASKTCKVWAMPCSAEPPARAERGQGPPGRMSHLPPPSRASTEQPRSDNFCGCPLPARSRAQFLPQAGRTGPGPPQDSDPESRGISLPAHIPYQWWPSACCRTWGERGHREDTQERARDGPSLPSPPATVPLPSPPYHLPLPPSCPHQATPVGDGAHDLEVTGSR